MDNGQGQLAVQEATLDAEGDALQGTAEMVAQAVVLARQTWLQGRLNAVEMARSARDIGDEALSQQHLQQAARCGMAVQAIDHSVSSRPEPVQAAIKRLLRGP